MLYLQFLRSVFKRGILAKKKIEREVMGIVWSSPIWVIEKLYLWKISKRRSQSKYKQDSHRKTASLSVSKITDGSFWPDPLSNRAAFSLQTPPRNWAVRRKRIDIPQNAG